MTPCRMVHVNLASGNDLNVVNCFTRMAVYAIIKISGDKENKDKVRTHTDPDGGADPTWNFSTQFTVNESNLYNDDLKLVFKLMSERILGDKEIGKVKAPLLELFHSAPGDGSFHSVSYPVKKPSGEPKGTLTFSYKLGEKFDVPSPGYGYAPPPHEEEKKEKSGFFGAVIGAAIGGIVEGMLAAEGEEEEEEKHSYHKSSSLSSSGSD